MTEIENITQWTGEALLANGYSLNGPLEDFQMTPWSSVRRILTHQGYIYLKQTPPLLSLESHVIQLLHNKLQANVPIIIAKNNDLRCFLMKDAGKPFYHYKENQLRKELIHEAINKYKYIQNECLSLVNVFLDLGVPDWRLNNFTNLYKNLVTQDDLLIEDGMPIDDIKMLNKTVSECEALCEQLNNFSIPETLDHCDLHGGNILIQDQSHTLTIIDWGETVITHPYFSLTFFLRGLVQYYSFEENDLWDCTFGNNNINSNDLNEMIYLVKKLEPAYSALAFHRLLLSSDKQKFMEAPNCKGRISKYLQEFMSAIQWGHA